MTAFVALLRAINVGGTGKLAMQDLRALCSAAGFEKVSTYIQSGNVVFHSRLGEKAAAAKLDRALREKLGAPVGVLVRTAAELSAIVDANPFPHANPSRVGVVFLPSKPPAASVKGIVAADEEVRAIGRELFIHYPNGMGRSKLKLPPPLSMGTTRNINTVRALASRASA